MTVDFKHPPKKTKKMMGHISFGDTLISFPFDAPADADEDDILNALIFEFSENSEMYWEEIDNG